MYGFPYNVLDQNTIDLEKVSGTAGAYNGSKVINGYITNNRDGGYIPWRGETRDVYIVGGIIDSPFKKNPKITLHAREVL